MERTEPLPRGARLMIWGCKAVTIGALGLLLTGIAQDAYQRHQDNLRMRKEASEQIREWNAAVQRWNATAADRARMNAEYERCIREAKEARAQMAERRHVGGRSAR